MIRFDVRCCNDSDEIQRDAETILMDFVGTDAVDRYRMMIEVHEMPPLEGSATIRRQWVGHVTARPKRQRDPDWDDF